MTDGDPCFVAHNIKVCESMTRSPGSEHVCSWRWRVVDPLNVRDLFTASLQPSFRGPPHSASVRIVLSQHSKRVWRQLAFIFSVPLSPALSSMYRLSIQQELLFGIRFRTQSSLSPNRKKQQDNFRHRLQRPAHCDRYTDREYLLGSRERIRAVPAHISLHARSSKGLGQVRKALLPWGGRQWPLLGRF